MTTGQPGRHDLAPMRTHHRSAWRVSALSVVWTLITGCAAVGLGLGSSSPVLTAFGAVSFLDALGSAALAYHFRHALRHDALSEYVEHLAHRVIALGLLVVGGGAILGGLVRLMCRGRTDSQPFGTVLAAVSAGVLLVLAHRKRVLARRVGSPALRSDGHLSAVGATQAGVTLVGTLTSAIGVWWADPGAALVVGAVTLVIGVQTWRSQQAARRALQGVRTARGRHVP